MDREMKRWLAVISIAIAVMVMLFLLLSGYDLSGIEVHKGIKIN